MKTSHILLLCILGAALVSSVVCQSPPGPDECCFSFYPRRVKKDLVKSYKMTEHRCPKVGVILVTRNSKYLCVDPNLSWVEGIMKHLDEQNL